LLFKFNVLYRYGEVVAETTKMNKRYTLAGMNEVVDEMFPPVAPSGWIVDASSVASSNGGGGGGAGGGGGGGAGGGGGMDGTGAGGGAR
jgi:hypothetical protein